jgi:hypothetical protein
LWRVIRQQKAAMDAGASSPTGGQRLKGILPPPRQRHHSSSAIEPRRFASLIPDPMEKRSIAHAGRRCDAAASQRIKGISS